MSVFEDYVQVELPRRSVTLTKSITGYDGDPNDVGAPDIIKVAPFGTWFREETAGKWWRKTETVWEEQGGGPGPGGETVKASATDTTPGFLDTKLEAGPGIDFEKLRLAANEAWRISAPVSTATQEDMTWTLDPVTGVSPPIGTIIETQAQFDALGAPLLYGNDVERIRPYWCNHNIIVLCAAGTIAAHGGLDFGPGYGDFILSQRGPAVNRDGVYDFTRSGGPASWWGAYPSTIVFAGTTVDIDASVAGTFSRDARTRQHTFTRTAGTWTAGALVGKWCEILTGPLAGTFNPIRSNDAGSFMIPGDADPGAVTVRIYELATHVEGGLYLGMGTSAPAGVSPFGWVFRNLDFQRPGAGAGYQSANSQATFFDSCYIRGFCRLDAGTLMLTACIYESNLSDGGSLDSFGPSYVTIYNCWLHGGGGGELLYLRSSVRGTLGQNCLEAGPGYAGYMLYFGEDCLMESMTGLTYLKGNGTCYGILMWGQSHFADRGWIVVDNCISAVNVFNQTVGTLNMLAGCEGNQYLFGVAGYERQIISVPIGLALSATAYTVAMTSAGGDITRAMLTAEGVAAGDRWEQAGYVFQF